jgi:flagellar L-ring protein precursor FlgH
MMLLTYTKNINLSVRTLLSLSLVLLLVSGCNLATRLSEVGKEPKISKIQNPQARPDYRPVSLPMPAPKVAPTNPNSLWRSGARAFFKDHRAKEIGDLVTVKLTLSDSATFANKTARDRKDSEDFDVADMLGLETEFNKVLPQGIEAAGGQIVNFNTAHSTSGDGSIARSEALSLTVAAVVTQILPNGSLVIMGRQEIRVDAELRELMITGVVRPTDIDSDNTVTDDSIAEMRVAYGGRGTLSSLQKPRWGMELWDILFPF